MRCSLPYIPRKTGIEAALLEKSPLLIELRHCIRFAHRSLPGSDFLVHERLMPWKEPPPLLVEKKISALTSQIVATPFTLYY